jgi:hypothetical protein
MVNSVEPLARTRKTILSRLLRRMRIRVSKIPAGTTARGATGFARLTTRLPFWADSTLHLPPGRHLR